jgi:class 3 adenylate cyclase
VSFRAQLLLAILGIVISATIASLYVAQRQNSASYRAVVDELFRNQTAAFQREQETRHEFAMEQVARLATSVRLFAALEEGDPGVYEIASDELRLGDFSFFRLLDANGRVIDPPDLGRAGELDVRGLRIPLAPAGLAERAAGDIQLGFLDFERSRSVSMVRVLAAPIENFGQHVGTLILGQGLASPAAVDREQWSGSGIQSAFWIAGQLVGGDIRTDVRPALAHMLGRAAPQDGELRQQDVTYRYHSVLLNPDSDYPAAWLVSTFSMAEFEAQQRALALRIALIGVLTSVVAGTFALGLSRQLARPVADLVTATHEIRRGNYAPQIPRSRTREMRTLAESFDDMAAGLALRDRYHSVLQQVADPEVAERLVSGQIELGGELRDVTVMFCDIRGYTALTVGRHPESVIRLLNHHMGAMTRIVQAHRGVINQFAGDAIMALFGAPRSYGDDARRAVECAAAMIRERERLNQTAEIPVRIGIGIASGSMVAGCIGAENRSDYTVVGERAILAARLSAAAKAGEILIDELTLELIAGVPASSPVAPLALKGFQDPVPAHRILMEPVTT